MRVVLVALLWWAFSCPAWAQRSRPSSRPTSMHASTRPTSVPWPRLVVEGRVLGQDGKPMAMAHVRLSRERYFFPMASVVVGPDGRFRIEGRLRGAVQLLFFGTHHRLLMIPLVVRRDMALKLKVVLKAQTFHHRIDKVRVIGDFNQFKRRGSVAPQRRADGLYQAVIPWTKPRLAYQIYGVVSWRPGLFGGRIAGTHAEGHTAHRNYISYRSWVSTKAGKATIVFDPKALPKVSKPAVVTWHRASPATQALWREFQAYVKNFDDTQKAFQRMSEHRRKLFRRRKPGQPFKRSRLRIKDFGFDVKKRMKVVERRWKQAKWPDARRMLSLHLAHADGWGMWKGKKAWQAAFCRDWGPRARLWRIGRFQRALMFFSFRSKTRRWACMAPHEAYIQAAPGGISHMSLLTDTAVRTYWIRRSRNPRVLALFKEFSSPADYQRRLQRLYIRYQKQDGAEGRRLARYASRRLRYLQRYLSPKRQIRRGLPVPAFRVKAMSRHVASRSAEQGTGQASRPVSQPDSRPTRAPSHYSHRTIRGRWTMLYFWSLWCGACISGMPGLHRAYRKFKPKGLEILSVALASDPEPVQVFLRDKYPMPWLHAIAPDGFGAPISKTFELTGVPRIVLVSPEGKIVALDLELRRKKLEKTLTRYLK